MSRRISWNAVHTATPASSSKRGVYAALAVTLLLVSQIPSHAWNKPGHMTTGTIAYDDLVSHDDTAVINKAIQLLRKNPHFTQPLGNQPSWQSQLHTVPLSEHNRYLFMLAARFPDDARGTSFHHGSWHFINLPFRPEGQPPSVPAPTPSGETIRFAFNKNLAIVKDKVNNSEEQRAIALCWLFHLVGDSHQPLHSTVLFTSQFHDNHGDMGGNLFFVKASEGGATVKLHALWDDMIIGSERFTDVRNRAISIRQLDAPRSGLDELGQHPNFDSWIDPESLGLAKTAAYTFHNSLLTSGPDDHNGALLPDGYLTAAKPIAVRRVALAGYRLADLLRSSL